MHRIMLVQENNDARHLLRRMLTLCGWEVVEASSLAEGLAQLDPPPDCLLLDLELPDGDGEAILRKVRSEHLPIRVFVYTGMEDTIRLNEISDLQPDAVLQKPINSEGLRKICESLQRQKWVEHPVNASIRPHSTPEQSPRNDRSLRLWRRIG